MFEEYGLTNIDSFGKKWERREIGLQMDNYTNKQFGRLTALFPVVIECKDKETRWLCQCSCGKTKVIKRVLLANGHTQSCGCIKSEKMHEAARKISGVHIGDRFGSLIVLEYLGSKENKIKAYYKCKCDCGNIIEASGNSLMTGRRKTCGLHNSLGELLINNILEEKNIKFKTQYTFNDLRSDTGTVLRFDFAIFNNNQLICLIEYQGSHHYVATGRQWNTEANLERVHFLDELKRNYCKTQNIKLYEIKYTDNIEKKIEEILSNYGIK